MLRVRVRMEPRAFFRAGSEPWLAERFLDERFGGAHVRAGGGCTATSTIRRRCARSSGSSDFARSLPGVTQVQAI